MDTVIVASSQFYSHYPKRIPQGTVNAEAVQIRLDSEWDGLTVIIHWLNVASGVEITPMLERDKPNTIPWEVLTELGELRMGLVGMDGDTTVKPTIWLTYGYVVDGVDPEAGDDPQPPTPSWEQQMVEQATQANQAAQAAQQAAEEAVKAVASAGPYAEQAKQSAEAGKASQDAAATSAQQANAAAQTAQEAVDSIGAAVEQAQSAATAAGSAQRAAETAQAGAAQSAGTAQTAATTAGQAAQAAQSAATQAGQYLTSVGGEANAAAAAATAAGKSQEAAKGAAQEAANARDQATTAATTAQGHASAASTSKDAAEQAATEAENAKNGAAQSAQAAASSASAAQQAQQAAEAAAALLPTPTQDDAGKVPMVNPEGTGYLLGDAGGSTIERILLSETTDKEVAAFSVTEDLEEIKTIRAVLGTPAADKNSTYLKVIFYLSGKQYLVMPFAAAPNTLPTQISIKLSIKDSGIAEINISGGRNQSDLSSPQVYNPLGNVANVLSQFKIAPNSKIDRFTIQAYDTVFPIGTNILIEGEGD